MDTNRGGGESSADEIVDHTPQPPSESSSDHKAQGEEDSVDPDDLLQSLRSLLNDMEGDGGDSTPSRGSGAESSSQSADNDQQQESTLESGNGRLCCEECQLLIDD